MSLPKRVHRTILLVLLALVCLAENLVIDPAPLLTQAIGWPLFVLGTYLLVYWPLRAAAPARRRGQVMAGPRQRGNGLWGQKGARLDLTFSHAA